MQRIRCRQKKYRAGLGGDESSEPDPAGTANEGKPATCTVVHEPHTLILDEMFGVANLAASEWNHSTLGQMKLVAQCSTMCQ